VKVRDSGLGPGRDHVCGSEQRTTVDLQNIGPVNRAPPGSTSKPWAAATSAYLACRTVPHEVVLLPNQRAQIHRASLVGAPGSSARPVRCHG
jgi:hypothetical protein